MSTRILLVDPDEYVLAGFAISLERHGFEVLAALNERDCVRHLCESAPNVLVLEPDTGDGWGCRLLARHDSTLPAVPIVVVSRKNLEDMRLGPEAGMCSWLTKPVTTNVLAAAISQAAMQPPLAASKVRTN